MSSTKFSILCAVAASLLTCSLLVAQSPIGTSFTYQGQLKDSGVPVNGSFDLEINLYDDAALIATENKCAVTVNDGVFTVELNFGPVFAGQALWLEVGVAPAGPCDATTEYTYLTPLQPLTAAPYSVYATESLQAAAADYSSDSDHLDGLDSTDFMSASGGTLTGDLIVTGTVSASAIDVDGVPIDSLESVVHPIRRYPAYLTCSSDAEPNPVQWSFITSGRFRITLEGLAYDIEVDFYTDPVVSMEDVAAKIQSAIRAATGNEEVVEWHTDHFVITSGDWSEDSLIAELETHSSGLGTDISGTPWMVCNLGNGAVTPVGGPDLEYYDGYLVRLDEGGRLDYHFIPVTTRIGVDTWSPSSSSATKTITHNLGKIPQVIRLNWISSSLLGCHVGHGVFDGATYATVYTTGSSYSMTSSYIIVAYSSSFPAWKAVVGDVTDTTFRLDISSFSQSESVGFNWEVE